MQRVDEIQLLRERCRRLARFAKAYRAFEIQLTAGDDSTEEMIAEIDAAWAALADGDLEGE